MIRQLRCDEVNDFLRSQRRILLSDYIGHALPVPVVVPRFRGRDKSLGHRPVFQQLIFDFWRRDLFVVDFEDLFKATRDE